VVWKRMSKRGPRMGEAKKGRRISEREDGGPGPVVGSGVGKKTVGGGGLERSKRRVQWGRLEAEKGVNLNCTFTLTRV